MFWGLIMEPQRRYTQQVKKAFHVSMAALDVSTSSDEPAQVMCGFEGRNYLLCTLKKPDMLQCSLDLNFEVGSELSFAANGKGHVHLTGYLIEEPLEGLSDEEEEADDAEEEQEVKSQKRNRKKQKNGSQAKKAKASSSNKEESDSDGSDVDVKTLLKKSFGESDDDDDSFNSDVEQDAEEEEEEDEDDGIEEEAGVEEWEDQSGEDSSANEGDSDEEVEVSPKKNNKVQMNGINKEAPTPKQKKEKKNQQKSTEKTTKKEGQVPKKKTLQGGVMVEDLKEGHGAPAKSGKFVTVYYEGRLKQTNKLFDATTKGAGFSFRLGSNEVIKGWDIGVQGMKVGGKRKIICPPNMAYGQKGSPPAIPANSTLVFEVELKKVR